MAALPKKEQIVLGNFVDIGVDLFVMGATLSYADYLVAQNPADQSPQELADLYCREARRRIEGNFRAVKGNFNRSYDKVAGLLMDGKLDWLAILLQLLNIAEEAAGTQFPRFDSDGKMLLPESQSAKLALRMLDTHGVGNALFVDYRLEFRYYRGTFKPNFYGPTYEHADRQV